MIWSLWKTISFAGKTLVLILEFMFLVKIGKSSLVTEPPAGSSFSHSLWNSLMVFSAIGFLFIFKVLPKSNFILNFLNTDSSDLLSVLKACKAGVQSNWSSAPEDGIKFRIAEIKADFKYSDFLSWIIYVMVNWESFSCVRRIFWLCILTTSAAKFARKTVLLVPVWGKNRPRSLLWFHQ